MADSVHEYQLQHYSTYELRQKLEDIRILSAYLPMRGLLCRLFAAYLPYGGDYAADYLHIYPIVGI